MRSPVPIGTVDAGDAEADRAHLAEHVGQAPLRIGLAEAERVADGEQQQQDRGCAICIGRLHSLSPLDERRWCNGCFCRCEFYRPAEKIQ